MYIKVKMTLGLVLVAGWAWAMPGNYTPTRSVMLVEDGWPEKDTTISLHDPSLAAPTSTPTVLSNSMADDANKAAAWIGLLAGAQSTMTGEDGIKTAPQAWIEGDTPISIGGFVPFRFFGRLGLSAEPGETLEIDKVETFKAVEGGFGIERIVGKQDVEKQTIITSVVAEWGWSSRLDTNEEVPKTRLVRHYGAGVRIREKASGATVTALYGRDEGAGDRGWGQYILYGYVPVPGTKETVQISIDATLSAGPSTEQFKQRDVLRVGVLVDMGGLLNLVK